MARKVLVRLVDDLDGLPSEGVATVTFSLDGVTYQIDLNQANASKLRDGLADYITAARRIGGRMKRGSAAGGRSAGSANDGPAIREWAREQGHELAERGRIPSHIVDAYHAANRGGRAKAPVRATNAPAPAKAAAASKTALAKATAPTGKATRAARGTRPAAAKATKAPATKSTATKAAPAKASTAKASTAKATTAKPAAKTAAKTTTAKATAAKPAAKTPRAAAKSPRATKSTVTAKTGQRGRRA
jgi:nucleoid-associated protein Lsr2